MRGTNKEGSLRTRGVTLFSHLFPRYLRVPSIPCVGSSGDSVFSSSSGIVVSGGSAPGTPGENSLASSAENLTDLNEEAGAATGQRERRKCSNSFLFLSVHHARGTIPGRQSIVGCLHWHFFVGWYEKGREGGFFGCAKGCGAVRRSLTGANFANNHPPP